MADPHKPHDQEVEQAPRPGRFLEKTPMEIKVLIAKRLHAIKDYQSGGPFDAAGPTGALSLVSKEFRSACLEVLFMRVNISCVTKKAIAQPGDKALASTGTEEPKRSLSYITQSLKVLLKKPEIYKHITVFTMDLGDSIDHVKSARELHEFESLVPLSTYLCLKMPTIEELCLNFGKNWGQRPTHFMPTVVPLSRPPRGIVEFPNLKCLFMESVHYGPVVQLTRPFPNLEIIKVRIDDSTRLLMGNWGGVLQQNTKLHTVILECAPNLTPRVPRRSRVPVVVNKGWKPHVVQAFNRACQIERLVLRGRIDHHLPSTFFFNEATSLKELHITAEQIVDDGELDWGNGDEDIPYREDPVEGEIRRTLEMSRRHPCEQNTKDSAKVWFESCATLTKIVICHPFAGKSVVYARHETEDGETQAVEVETHYAGELADDSEYKWSESGWPVLCKLDRPPRLSR